MGATVIKTRGQKTRGIDMLLLGSEEEGGTRSEAPGSCVRLGKSRSGQDCNSPGTLFFSLRTNSGTSDIQKCESLLLGCGIRLWWLNPKNNIRAVGLPRRD